MTDPKKAGATPETCSFCRTPIDAADHEDRCNEVSFQESRTEDEYDYEK